MSANKEYKRIIYVTKAKARPDINVGGNNAEKGSGMVYQITYTKPGQSSSTKKDVLFYIKVSGTATQANNEVLANHMYLTLGVHSALGYIVATKQKSFKALFPELIEYAEDQNFKDTCFIGSKMWNLVPIQQRDVYDKSPQNRIKKQVAEGFVADCFLANYDAGKIKKEVLISFTVKILDGWYG
eukprot:UN04969